MKKNPRIHGELFCDGHLVYANSASLNIHIYYMTEIQANTVIT